MNISKTKSKKLIKKKEKKMRKEKKKLEIFFFFDKNTKRKTPQPHKRLIWRWKNVGEINHVIYKKKKKKKILR